MKISVFGSGYVGLVSGACFSELGHDVVCVDVNEKKIQDLKQGIIPIYEPGLDELVKKNQEAARLTFTTNAEDAIKHGVVIFNAVGTPPDSKGRADLQYVYQVAKCFAENIDEYKVLVNKSTVPVGTGATCQKQIKEVLDARGLDDLEFSVVSNPEFLKEGSAIPDFMHPDRIVCGTSDETAKKYMQELYKPLTDKGYPLFLTDLYSSELSKYASNAYLATRISFINEISRLAEATGGDINDIATIMGMDTRIGPKFLRAGLGYGGSCFPKDVKALINTGKENNIDFKIIHAAETVNAEQKKLVTEKLSKHMESLKGKTIAVWGVAFKPNTDDVREAPSHTVFDELLKQKVGSIQAYDPVAMEEMEHTYGPNNKISYVNSKQEACDGADALLVLTEWDEFTDAASIAMKHLAGNIIIDGRNIRDHELFEKHGFTYEGVGK